MTIRWWPPGAITFTKAQVFFLLLHISLLRELKWPPEHKQTGYSGKKSSRAKSAPYENIAPVTADLLSRIEKCGEDGLLMEIVYSDPDNYHSLLHHIAKAKHLDESTVEKRLNDALRYIRGKCPRWVDCPGVEKCLQCHNCRNLKDEYGNIKCNKLPRWGRSYDNFKGHKRGANLSGRREGE